MIKELEEKRLKTISGLLDYCKLLPYNTEDEESMVEEFTEYYNEDLNKFLIEIYNRKSEEYTLGKTLETILCWGHKLSEIKEDILKKYLSHLVLCENSFEGCNWDASHGYRWESDYYDDYMHFKFFDILVDLDTFDGDENILAECLSNEKEKGYVYILISKNKITNKKLIDSVYGVIEGEDFYNLCRDK